MRAEQHGDAELLLKPADQHDNIVLVAQIEADQRLVEQQEARAAEQGLRQQQALPFAAGDFAEGPPRQCACANEVERAAHLVAPRGVEKRQSPAMPVHRPGQEVLAGQPNRADRAVPLRHVADGGVAAASRLAEDADRAGARRDGAQDRPQQRRLAAAVGAQHADELRGPDRQRDVLQDDARAIGERHVRQLDRVHRPAGDSAVSSASSWPSIQLW